jgi:hypothetical protein
VEELCEVNHIHTVDNSDVNIKGYFNPYTRIFGFISIRQNLQQKFQKNNNFLSKVSHLHDTDALDSLDYILQS